ncbi:MAG: MBL fold metallo-hydrolase [Methylococcales bacterium]|jgi:metallo-beta-lactamase family protein|nr:MBL fold metallo-hydrolase [Methylococcales bacterium]MBT7443057.1 MBL fold metallo-hydrolase [Methylococcales bacterium]
MEIQFIGGAGQVTGTCLLFRVGKHQFLLDCGLVQGSATEEARNLQPFPFDAFKIDAMILSSAHLHHSGLLPMLVSEGFKGNIYTHSTTRDQVRITLKDHGHLNERCAEVENAKRLRKGMVSRRPLYTLQESQNALRLFSVMEYGEWQQVLPGVEVCLFDAKYFSGTSTVMVRMTEGSRTRTVVYGGQIGDRQGSYIGAEHEEQVDLVLLNSTFGAHIHKNRDESELALGEIFSKESNLSGNILIPSPTIGRTQALLEMFADHYQGWHLDRWKLVVDHLMATEAKAAYGLEDEEEESELFELPNLQVARTVNQSLAVNKIQSGAIILASTEMCTAGRIMHHLKHNVWNEKCHVVLLEYQANGSIGRKLYDGKDHIRLWGETIKVRAKIHKLYSLSGQADRDGMAEWFTGFKGRPTVALIEGEKLSFQSMEQKVQQMSQSRVIVPGQGVILDLG